LTETNRQTDGQTLSHNICRSLAPLGKKLEVNVDRAANREVSNKSHAECSCKSSNQRGLVDPSRVKWVHCC